MTMNGIELLNAIIDDGSYEIMTTYTRPDQKMKRDGGVAGFEACRGKEAFDLLDLVAEAKIKTNYARENNCDDYWYHRMYELQVEWVINVLSAALCANNLEPLVIPTARGYAKAMDILGVKTS